VVVRRTIDPAHFPFISWGLALMRFRGGRHRRIGGLDVDDRNRVERGRSGRIARAGGIIGMAVGVVLLAVVVQQVHGTGHAFRVEQRDAAVALQARWEQRAPAPARVPEGEGLVRLHAPRLGPDFAHTVVAGTTQAALARGPGHYTGTALPGQPGNFAVAGHRVTHGAPFGDIDRLESCDALVVETATSWFVYRVLPLREEAPGVGGRQGRAGALPGRGTAARALPGRAGPARRRPGGPVPDRTGARAASGRGAGPPPPRARLITLTTCHPRYSARERLIVHGVLVAQYPRGAERRPSWPRADGDEPHRSARVPHRARHEPGVPGPGDGGHRAGAASSSGDWASCC
jgi:sortase (surface protein transpeptidase)